LAAFAPIWLEGILTPEFYERYGQKVEHSKRTRTAAEKEAKAIAIGQAGFYLLDAIYAENTSASIRSLKAVEVLRQVWLQQYYAPGGL
jgi:transposase